MKSSAVFQNSPASFRYTLWLFALVLGGNVGCAQIADTLGSDSRFRAISIDSQSPGAPLSCDPALTDSYGGGDGSVGSPFKICSLVQWKNFGTRSADWSSNFALSADLDFSGVSAADIPPVGTLAVPFTGTFSGGEHKLSNIALPAVTQKWALFLQTNGTAKIQNLKIENMTVSANDRLSAVVLDHGSGGKITLTNLTLTNVSLTSTSAGIVDGMGALLGAATGEAEITDHVITNLTVVYPGNARDSGAVIGTSTANFLAARIAIAGLSLTKSSLGGIDYLGGFMGALTSPSTFRDITITGLAMNTSWGGAGLVSRAYASATFERVRIAGSITSGGGQSGLIQEMGGFGPTPTLTITDSSYVGALVSAGNSNYGGLVGTAFGNLTIQRSYHIGDMAVWSGGVGGLAGQVGNTGTTVLIEDSFSRGTTTTTHATQGRASGLVGVTAGGMITIRRSYAARANAGTATPGKSCVIDYNSGTLTLEEVYFDSTLCAGATDFNTALTGASGSTTSAFQTTTPFTNWLPATWTFAAAAYPTLVAH